MSLFSKKVLEITKLIPKGHVASYGQVALLAGTPRAAIAVGGILHVFGDSPNVPWWRVVNHLGRISTKCFEHNANLQKTLLIKEGIAVSKKLTLNINKFRWHPTPSEIKKAGLPDEYIKKLFESFQI